ncbi:MAG TPA: PDZ domain-containing protein [Chryseosolibacter sp.]
MTSAFPMLRLRYDRDLRNDQFPQTHPHWSIQLGFQDKDKIVAINGEEYDNIFQLIGHRVLIDSNTTYTVERNGKQLDLRIGKPPGRLNLYEEPFLSVYVPFEVAFVQQHSRAEEAGLQKGDRIVKVNDTPIVTRMEMIRLFDADADGMVTLRVIRPGNEGDTLAITATLNEEKRLGFAARELFEITEYRYSFGESIKKGISRASAQIRGFAKVVAGDLAPRTATPVGGPIAINSAFERSFIAPLAATAVWYGFYNLLPLPIAAFWEIIPLGYEAVTRRKLPYRFFKACLTVAWCVVIGLVLWVFVMDLMKLFA